MQRPDRVQFQGAQVGFHGVGDETQRHVAIDARAAILDEKAAQNIERLAYHIHEGDQAQDNQGPLV